MKNLSKNINHQIFRDHCHYTGKYGGVAHSICNLKFNMPNKIPAVFHNGSIYDYHFIIKELANKFDGQFKCLGVNQKKYNTFFVLIKKIIKIDNDGNESVTTISYKLKLMASLLSNLADNLA